MFRTYLRVMVERDGLQILEADKRNAVVLQFKYIGGSVSAVCRELEPDHSGERARSGESCVQGNTGKQNHACRS